MKILNLLIFGTVALLASGSGCQQSGSSVLQTGDSVSTAAFGKLRSALQAAIQQHGLPGAVAYCQVNADSIVGAVIHPQLVSIQRVALRNRQPANVLTATDAEQWQHFSELQSKGDSLQPVVVANGSQWVYYKPILMQPMCMSCHGSRTQMDAVLVNVIDSLYPNDKAVDFSPGDLRGMWKLTFK